MCIVITMVVNLFAKKKSREKDKLLSAWYLGARRLLSNDGIGIAC